MSAPERRFENLLAKALMDRGLFAHHVDMDGCDGWPDLVVLGRGRRCLLVECKYGDEDLRPTQKAFWAHMVAKYEFTSFMLAVKERDGTYLSARFDDGMDAKYHASIDGVVDEIWENL